MSSAAPSGGTAPAAATPVIPTAAASPYLVVNTCRLPVKMDAVWQRIRSVDYGWTIAPTPIPASAAATPAATTTSNGLLTDTRSLADITRTLIAASLQDVSPTASSATPSPATSAAAAAAVPSSTEVKSFQLRDSNTGRAPLLQSVTRSHITVPATKASMVGVPATIVAASAPPAAAVLPSDAQIATSMKAGGMAVIGSIRMITLIEGERRRVQVKEIKDGERYVQWTETSPDDRSGFFIMTHTMTVTEVKDPADEQNLSCITWNTQLPGDAASTAASTGSTRMSRLVPFTWMAPSMRTWQHAILLSLRASFQNTMYAILPHLYLGGARSADDTHQMKAAGITHIVNVTADSPPKPWAKKDFNVLYVPLNDEPGQSLFPCATQTHAFIDDARRSGGRIFVHCSVGQSRSVVNVLHHLLQLSSSVTLLNCWHYVRECKNDVNPQADFIRQLSDAECKLRAISTPTINLVEYRVSQIVRVFPQLSVAWVTNMLANTNGADVMTLAFNESMRLAATD